MIRKLVVSKESLKSLIDYLYDVNEDFEIPLSEKTDIKSFAEKLLQFGNVIIIEELDKIIGCIGFYNNDSINLKAYIPILSVKSNYSGNGYAKLLINETINECNKKGIKSINVDSVNQIAIRLYKSFGFKTIKTMRTDTCNKEFLKLDL